MNLDTEGWRQGEVQTADINLVFGGRRVAPDSLYRQADGCCHLQRVNLSLLMLQSKMYRSLEVPLPSCQPYFFILTYIYIHNECIYHKHQHA